MKHLVVIIDDNPSDMYIGMPLLAARTDGIFLTGMQHTIPLCSPARSVFHSGRYPCRNGVLRNADVPQPDDENTIGAVCQRAGIRTWFGGKYNNVLGILDEDDEPLDGHSRNYRVPGWDEWLGYIGSSYFGAIVNINGQMTRQPDDVYATDWYRDRLAEWVTERDADGDDWLAVLAVANCHEEPSTPICATRHTGLFEDAVVDHDEEFNPPDDDDWATMADWLKDLYPDPLTEQEVEDYDVTRRLQWESLLSVDELLCGREGFEGLLEIVDEDTAVWVFGDNGFLLGEHRMPAKEVHWRQAMNPNCWVRFPGATPRTEDALCSLIDIPATIVSTLHGQWPLGTDGKSLEPLLVDGTAIHTAVWAEGHQINQEGKRFFAAITKDWKYTFHGDEHEELYDRSVPELRNLAGDAEYAATLATMREVYASIRPDVIAEGEVPS